MSVTEDHCYIVESTPWPVNKVSSIEHCFYFKTILNTEVSELYYNKWEGLIRSTSSLFIIIYYSIDLPSIDTLNSSCIEPTVFVTFST